MDIIKEKDNLKDLFFGLNQDEIFLDNAASTPPFKKVMNEVIEFLSNYGSIHRGFGNRSDISTSKYEEAREKIKKLMKSGSTHDLFFISNTTEGINRISLMLLEEKENTGRDIIVVSEIEHSANLLPYTPYFNIKTIKTTENFDIDLSDLDNFLKKYSKRILAVSFAGSSNVTGKTINIQKIYKMIKNYDENIYFMIDASQYAPHFSINAEDADIWVFSGHKTYAPFGIGGILANKRLLKNMKYSFKGGGDVEYIYPDNTSEYKYIPYNQEIGTPNGVGAIAMAKAFEILYEDICFDNIHKHEKEVSDKLIAVLLKYNCINVLLKSIPIIMVDIEKNDTEKFFIDNKINARMEHFHF